MDDLISRQATVDLIERMKPYHQDADDIAEMIANMPPSLPNLDEWCTDCKEYDNERHCCPRWNRVIRQTVEDMQAAQPGWTTDVNDILAYLDDVVHPLVSPENWNVYSELYDMVSALPSTQPSVSKTEIVGDAISRRAAVSGISDLLMLKLKGERLPTYNEVYRVIYDLPSAQTELENKIRAIGYTGREGRIYIGGRLFAVRELPQ